MATVDGPNTVGGSHEVVKLPRNDLLLGLIWHPDEFPNTRGHYGGHLVGDLVDARLTQPDEVEVSNHTGIKANIFTSMGQNLVTALEITILNVTYQNYHPHPDMNLFQKWLQK